MYTLQQSKGIMIIERHRERKNSVNGYLLNKYCKNPYF